MTHEELSLLLTKAAGGDTLTVKELAAIGDAFWETQVERLKADKVAEALKAKETLYQSCVIEQLRKQELSAIGGTAVILELKKDDQPKVEDWVVFQKYILKTKDFSLLERRPGKAAIKERWEDGKEVPGVSRFPVYKLSRRKV